MKTRPIALAGLLGLVVLAWGTLQGAQTLEAAATKAAVLVVALAVVERVAIPVAGLLVGQADRRHEPRSGGPVRSAEPVAIDEADDDA